MARVSPPFRAYRGSSRHLFVCYSHDDSAIVYDAISHLHEAGLPVYYDEGITPAAGWQDELVSAIEQSGLLLFFISAGSLASQHCVNEVTLAQSSGIPVLPVYLDDIELRGGLRLALATTQGIERRRWDNAGFRVQLLGAVNQVMALHQAPATFLVARLDVSWARDRSELDLRRQFNRLLASVMTSYGGVETEEGSHALRSIRFDSTATGMRAGMVLQTEFDTLITGLGEPRPALAILLLQATEGELGVLAAGLLGHVSPGVLHCSADVVDALPELEANATKADMCEVAGREYTLLRVDTPRPARILVDQFIVETDVRRFNELGGLETLERFINAYQNTVEREARRFGGVIRRTDFDSILLTFDSGPAAVACCRAIAGHWQRVTEVEGWQQHHIKFLGTWGRLLFVRGFVLGRALERLAALNGASRRADAPECEFLLADGRMVNALDDASGFREIGSDGWIVAFEQLKKGT